MKSVGIIVLLVLIFAVPASGQNNYPSAELFGGYSFSHSQNSFNINSHNLHGWGASISASGNKYFGFTADFSGNYGHDPVPSFIALAQAPVPPGLPSPLPTQSLSVYHFLGGPRFTFRTERATLFTHALFGAVRVTHGEPVSGSQTEFAMGFGGGVDVPLGKRLAFRIFQADYIPAKRSSPSIGWDYDFRVQTGIVFTFGKR